MNGNNKKKSGLHIACLVVFLYLISSAAYAALGDVNNDTNIDIIDALLTA